jgi:hypothetical protein
MTSDNRRTSVTSHASGTRPSEYVVVIAASDWVKERFPAAGANLYDALQAGKDRHREPEIDLEAES